MTITLFIAIRNEYDLSKLHSFFLTYGFLTVLLAWLVGWLAARGLASFFLGVWHNLFAEATPP